MKLYNHNGWYYCIEQLEDGSLITNGGTRSALLKEHFSAHNCIDIAKEDWEKYKIIDFLNNLEKEKQMFKRLYSLLQSLIIDKIYTLEELNEEKTFLDIKIKERRQQEKEEIKKFLEKNNIKYKIKR